MIGWQTEQPRHVLGRHTDSPTHSSPESISHTLTHTTFCNVKIEEIAVESSLHAARYNGYQVEEALGEVAEHPVGNVEPAVGAQCKQVVGCDGLRLPRLGDHVELRHDGHALQVDGERPQDLWSRCRDCIA